MSRQASRVVSYLLISAFVSSVVVACGSGDESVAPDAAVVFDAMPAIDAPAATYGTVTGSCGDLATDLTSASPSVFEAHFEFPRLYTSAEDAALAEGTLTILATPNAGGSSELSEAFLFEALARCEDAELFATEGDIEYEPDGAKTDLAVTIDGMRVGVSVARAMGFPLDTPYTVDNATTLLTGKLEDILESSANVKPAWAWDKQILGVMAVSSDHAASLQTALASIDPAIKADTIVWIVITDGADEFIYCNGPCDA